MSTLATLVPRGIVVRGVADQIAAVYASEPYLLKNGRHQITFVALGALGQYTRTGLETIEGVAWMTTYEGEKIDWKLQPYAELGEDQAHRRAFLTASLDYTEVTFRHERE